MPLWNPYDVGAAIAIHLATAPHKRIVTGTFTGDDSDDRQITTGFKCSRVVCYGTSESRAGEMIPGKGWTFASMGSIQGSSALHATDGFIVSKTNDSLNFTGMTYFYWAVEE